VGFLASRLKKELSIPTAFLIAIILAEIITSLYSPTVGLALHALILVSLLVTATYTQERNPSGTLFLSLSLAPLIRILSLSLPLIYFPRILWFLVAGIPILAATLVLIRVLNLSRREAGITLNKPYTQVAIAFTGILFGLIEYLIMKPKPLIETFSLSQTILPSIMIIFSTGFVEELAFRGVMQPIAIQNLGRNLGLIYVTAIFAALHIGNLSIMDLIFVFIVGLFFGYVVLKTKSLVGVTLSHGITNIFLYLVAPFTLV
jgi:membrane protease YdiL (CAAX protease family)